MAALCLEALLLFIFLFLLVLFCLLILFCPIILFLYIILPSSSPLVPLAPLPLVGIP
jgi:hypothetical protein